MRPSARRTFADETIVSFSLAADRPAQPRLGATAACRVVCAGLHPYKLSRCAGSSSRTRERPSGIIQTSGTPRCCAIAGACAAKSSADWPGNMSICTHPGGPACASTTRGVCIISPPATVYSVRLGPHLTRLSCTPWMSSLSLARGLCRALAVVIRAYRGPSRDGAARHPRRAHPHAGKPCRGASSSSVPISVFSHHGKRSAPSPATD